jgi:hypothetical protein
MKKKERRGETALYILEKDASGASVGENLVRESARAKGLGLQRRMHHRWFINTCNAFSFRIPPEDQSHGHLLE